MHVAAIKSKAVMILVIISTVFISVSFSETAQEQAVSIEVSRHKIEQDTHILVSFRAIP